MQVNNRVAVRRCMDTVTVTVKLQQCCQSTDMDSTLNTLKKYLKRENVQIIYVKMFGQVEMLHAVQNSSLQKEKFICAALKNPGERAENGLLLFGIRRERLSDIQAENTKTGQALSYLYNGTRFLHAFTEFTDSECGYHDSECMLKNHGFRAKDTVRAWIYLKNILTQYAEYNTVRNAYFKKHDISCSGESQSLPASTCIGGETSTGKSLLHTYACQSGGDLLRTERITNSMQNEAEGNTYLYRPAFARAKLLTFSRWKELQISGTASIDTEGKTVFCGNYKKQIETTVANIKNILQSVGMNAQHIMECTVFMKDLSMKKIMNEVFSKNCFSYIPKVIVQADVCRDDLLFEIDGVARALQTEK